jgi:hypothetical protein
LKHPKTFAQMNALLTPKWSAWRDKLLTSCLSDISQCQIAIFDYVCTKWAAHSGEYLPHVLWHPKISGPQSTTVFTPKWSTQSGEISTSCVKALAIPVCNLRTCSHKTLSQPGF